jgi:DNA-directed RNA polymerase sigma subunit (sigma70/sigma32)
MENLETETPTIESDLQDSWRGICLADIEAILPNLEDDNDRIIIEKHYLQDPPMTLVKIANELKIAYDTVKKRHSRGVEKLRKLLKHYLTKQTVK